MSHDAPMVSARFIYGSTTTQDGSATIQHGGATNAHDASTIRYGASTIQAGSVTTSHECARFNGWHVTVGQIMTPNIIISSTFDEASHVKKQNQKSHLTHRLGSVLSQVWLYQMMSQLWDRLIVIPLRKRDRQI